MTQANDSHIATVGASGSTVATQLAGGKEHQVVCIAGSDGHIKGTKDTYYAVNKLATDAAVSALTFTHVANADKVYATLHHAATATKRVTLKKVELFIAATAAGILNLELRRITATTLPATGNPQITPISANADTTPASEAICLSLPTTAPSMVANQPFFSQEFNLGANTAQTTSFPADAISLFPPEGMPADDDWYELTIPAGVAGGYAIVARNSAAVAIKFTVRWIFTEE